MDSNNIFSNGSLFSLTLQQDTAEDPLLPNNSIQSWYYRHVKDGAPSTDSLKSMDFRTSFKSNNDPVEGVFQGLTLQAYDRKLKKKSEFLLKITQKYQLSLDSDPESSSNLPLAISIILGIPYFYQFAFVDVKLKMNFGYYSARFLTFLIIFSKSIWGDLSASAFTVIFLVQFFEVSLLSMVWLRSAFNRTFSSGFKERRWSSILLMLIPLALLIFLSSDVNYYPMVIFVPLLMALVDRMFSVGCQGRRLLLIAELSKFLVVFIGCYFPYYINPLLGFEGSLLMSFNYTRMTLFFFVGFVGLPALFFSQLIFSKKGTEELDVVLRREVVHGKDGKMNPACIQEGQGDIAPTSWKFLSDIFPGVFTTKKVSFYHKRSFLGVIEVGLEKTTAILTERPVEQTPTGFINFYRYRSGRNQTTKSFQQHCQHLGYKPYIKFKVMNDVADDAGMVNLIPVETPESTSEQKFVAIITKTYGKPSLSSKKIENFENKIFLQILTNF